MKKLLKQEVKSFKAALQGFKWSLSERHIRFHFLATLTVIALGFVCSISKIEWMVILLAIALVMALELVNTAIEKLCDKLHPNTDDAIGKVKDMAAAAVLFTSLLAGIIGGIIFIPKLLSFIV